MIGRQLAHFRITAKLGEGGMGEVYRAQDTKLGREVAIKVLPRAFSDDAQRMARFEREARVLASLNHPGIAGIYGLEEDGDVRALVLELVEGPTLADRLAGGPLPVDDAFSVACQIAEALEAAHARGVVHRDLKPQNVKIDPDGRVKVLDFGLAKALDPVEASGSASASRVAASPTLTLDATLHGVILGTAAYMAPEQAKGAAVDKRADIWAFGVVLWEMLAGRRLFEGDSVPETLAGVLKSSIELEALPPETPSAIRRLLRRCLARDPRARLHDIADARIVLQELERGELPDAVDPAVATGGRQGLPGWLQWTIGAAAGLLLGFAVARLVAPDAQPAAPPLRARLSLALPAEAPLAAGNFLPSLAFSPAGDSLAYVAEGPDGVRRLAVRRLDTADARVIPGTEGAEGPFFSPDGAWIGYWAQWKIRKVRASGAGLPEVVCDSLDFRGATWAGNSIVFTPGQTTTLFRVAESGGEPEPLTTLREDETSHRFPHALPDGDTVLFSSWSNPFDLDRAVISAVSLSSGTRRDLGDGSHDARYSPTGHLLYVQGGRLLAVPFDLEELRITGAARVVVEPVVKQRNTGGTQFDVSSRGDLAWVEGDTVGDEVQLVRKERSGEQTPIFETRTVHRFPDLAPDDRSLLVQAIGVEEDGIWWMSADGRQRRRLMSSGSWPAWLPAARWVATVEKSNRLVIDSLDGTAPSSSLVIPGLTSAGTAPDGRIVYSVQDSHGDVDTLLLDPESGDSQAFLTGPTSDGGVQFSPDGRYASFVSDRTGRFEVFVTSFPDQTATWQVSTAGGSEAVWRGDGEEIVFRSANDLVAVPVTTEPTFRAGTPTVLFQMPYDGVLGNAMEPNFDAASDGSWFLTVYGADLNEPAGSVEIALGWSHLLDGN
ncbi:MAG: protein kinase [Thermoanaerobaculia bacterium]